MNLTFSACTLAPLSFARALGTRLKKDVDTDCLKRVLTGSCR